MSPCLWKAIERCLAFRLLLASAFGRAFRMVQPTPTLASSVYGGVLALAQAKELAS
jgi:hypothetical protein